MTQLGSPSLEFSQEPKTGFLRGCWSRGLKRRPLLQTSSPASYECSKLQLNGMCVIQNCLSLWVHPKKEELAGVP